MICLYTGRVQGEEGNYGKKSQELEMAVYVVSSGRRGELRKESQELEMPVYVVSSGRRRELRERDEADESVY